MERGSDRLAWSSPGTFPEPEVVKSQGPQQIEVYSRHQLLETATPNHSIDLGPQAAGRGLENHRGGGDWGRMRAGRQATGGVHLLRGSGSKASPSQPIHPQCYPPGSKVRQAECCTVTTGTEWQEPRQLCLRQGQLFRMCQAPKSNPNRGLSPRVSQLGPEVTSKARPEAPT